MRYALFCVPLLVWACASKPAEPKPPRVPTVYEAGVIELKAQLAEYRSNLAAAATLEDIARWEELSEQIAIDLENASRACEYDRTMRMQYQPSLVNFYVDIWNAWSAASRRAEAEQIRCR